MNEFELVVLEDDLPGGKLKKGDVGTIVTVYGEGKGYEVEFVTYTGETLAVETLLPQQIRKVKDSEVMAVRDTAA